MGSKYWDIDDFLAEDELIGVVSGEDCYNMAFLNNSGKESTIDLGKDTKLEIPLWLATKLSTHGIVTIDIPLIYRERFKKMLNADATVINLREKTPFYYEIGMKLCEYIEDDTLVPTLSGVFLDRAKMVIKKSFCLKTEESNTFVRKLTNLEKKLFENGRENITNYKFWMDDTTDNVQLANFSRMRKKLKVN